jgi:hypothetical protein
LTNPLPLYFGGTEITFLSYTKITTRKKLLNATVLETIIPLSELTGPTLEEAWVEFLGSDVILTDPYRSGVLRDRRNGRRIYPHVYDPLNSLVYVSTPDTFSIFDTVDSLWSRFWEWYGGVPEIDVVVGTFYMPQYYTDEDGRDDEDLYKVFGF